MSLKFWWRPNFIPFTGTEESSQKTMTWLRRHLLVQGQQWKHQNNVWKLSNVNNNQVSDVNLVPLQLTLNRFPHYFASIIDFEQVNGDCE